MSILLEPEHISNTSNTTLLTPLQLLTNLIPEQSSSSQTSCQSHPSSSQFVSNLQNSNQTESLTSALARLAGQDSSSLPSEQTSASTSSSCSDEDTCEDNTNDNTNDIADSIEASIVGCGAPDCIALPKACGACCSCTAGHTCSVNVVSAQISPCSHSSFQQECQAPSRESTQTVVTTNKVLIMKTTGNLEIPPGIKTVLVEGNRKKVYVQLPNKDFKCIGTELGEICSSVPITIVNIGHTKVIVQAPKGRSIYKFKRLTVKMGESATFQALGSIWYHIC